jgi:hypothetical protein
MKWIGQNIYDQISRFRNDVYLEDISTGTIASGAHLGLDSNNKIVKAVDGGGDLTSIVAGTGLSGTSLTGPIPTLNVDASQTQITAVGTIGTGVWNGTAIASAYLDADTAHLSGTQDITGEKTIGGEAAPTNKLYFRDGNSYINSPTANDLEIAATDITLDAATSVKIETSDLTMYDPVNDGNPTISLGSSATNRFEIKTAYNSGAQTLDEVYFNTYTTSSTANDGRYIWQVDEVELARLLDGGLYVSGYINANSDGAYVQSRNTTTSSATEGGKLRLICDDGAAMADDHRLGVIEFQGAEDASSSRQTGASIQAMCDAAWSASENGTRLEFYTMDGNASSELSLTLDSDLLATFAGAATITGLTTLSGNLTFDSVALTGVQTSAESFADNDTSLMTSAAIDDAIIKGGSATIIKVLPRDFMANEDGGVNKSILYDDTGTIGVRTSSDNSELYAFVEIPVGKTATSVIVYGNDTNNVVEVFEADINASGLADKTPGAGCVVGTACDITDVAADATNYLAIRVTTTAAASDIVYGAAVTISG